MRFTASNIRDQLHAAATSVIGSAYTAFSTQIKSKLWTVIGDALFAAQRSATVRAWARITTDGLGGVTVESSENIDEAAIGGTGNSVLTLDFLDDLDGGASVTWSFGTSMGPANIIAYTVSSTVDGGGGFVYLTLLTQASGAAASWAGVVVDIHVQIVSP